MKHIKKIDEFKLNEESTLGSRSLVDIQLNNCHERLNKLSKFCNSVKDDSKMGEIANELKNIEKMINKIIIDTN